MFVEVNFCVMSMETLVTLISVRCSGALLRKACSAGRPPYSGMIRRNHLVAVFRPLPLTW